MEVHIAGFDESSGRVDVSGIYTCIPHAATQPHALPLLFWILKIASLLIPQTGITLQRSFHVKLSKSSLYQSAGSREPLGVLEPGNTGSRLPFMEVILKEW